MLIFFFVSRLVRSFLLPVPRHAVLPQVYVCTRYWEGVRVGIYALLFGFTQQERLTLLLSIAHEAALPYISAVQVTWSRPEWNLVRNGEPRARSLEVSLSSTLPGSGFVSALLDHTRQWCTVVFSFKHISCSYTASYTKCRILKFDCFM